MTINHVLYKNNLMYELDKKITELRNQLLEELYAAGSDPVLYQRRYNMIKHLHLLQAQLTEKIKNFVTDDARDYMEIDAVILDVYMVISRNA
jgi:hypothetical protein